MEFFVDQNIKREDFKNDEEYKIQLTVNRIKSMESTNLKNKELKDSDMVSKIMDLIKETVNTIK